MADSSRAQLRKLKDEYARNPGSRVFVHLAEAHRKAGELRQAQQVLAEGLRRHMDYPSGLVVLAKVHADQGDDERATAVWRDVVRLDPENVVALRALADIAEAAGRRDEAMELYRQLVRLENGAPDDDDTQFAPPSFGDDDAEPVPVASAPAQEPERAPVAAPAKSRFSWLVRSVTRGVAEPKEPARPAFNLEEALAEPAGAVAAMEAPAVEAPPAPEPVREEPAVAEPAPDAEFRAEVEAPEQLSESGAELPPLESAEVQEEPAAHIAEPAVQIPDEEVEPAVPLPDSETEPPAVVAEAPSDEFEGILPVEELNTFEGILPATAELDDRILPGDIVVLGADRGVELDTTPPELGEVEAPAEEDEESEDEEIEREDIETQEQIVADAGIAAELDDEIEDVIGEPEAADPDEEIEETVSEHAGAVLDEEDAPAAEPASAIRFEELAQLAYEGGAVVEPAHAPPPDPYAHLRAELFGGRAAETEADELAGAPAALAEVLVRLLERDGSVMKAESSLRRLLAVALARELGLNAPQQDALALAAILGSLGELSEPGGTDTGRQLAVTLQLLSGIGLPEAAREALAHQYERWDGAGLPAGLKEDGIPFPARVLAVAREAAALLGERGRGPSAVVDELQRHAGSAFDPIVVSVLRRVFAQRERHGIGYGWGGRVAVAHPLELRALELAARLHGEGYAAETAGTAAELREQLHAGSLQALVLGADLPDADAGALVREVRGMSATLPVLVVDAGDARRRVELLGAGADVCFPPDAEFPEVRATLDALLRRRESAA